MNQRRERTTLVWHVLALLALAGGFANARIAAQEKPLKLVIACGEGQAQLLNFKKYLEDNFRVQCAVVEATKVKDKEKKETPFIGLEAFIDCDVILSNLYRTSAPSEQLEILKKAFRSKPVVGMRKAHHGFQNWLDADKEVFGVKYRGHYFGKGVAIQVLEKHQKHPFFEDFKPFLPGGGLYQHIDVAADVEVYMVGGPEGKPTMPQVWSREDKSRGGLRAFYTCYDPKDLSKDMGVRTMVTRALFWAANRDEKALRNN